MPQIIVAGALAIGGTIIKEVGKGQRAAEVRSKAQRAEDAALPTAAEVQALDSLVSQREKAVEQGLAETKRFEEQVAALDPVIREASEQQLQILRGRAADILKPIRQRRERQKAQLEQQLASRLGSGFRTSTAGVQALIGFDVATDELLAENQFKALAQLGQTASGAAGVRGALVNQLATISTIGTNLTLGELQARGRIAERQVGAVISAPVAEAPGQELGGVLQQAGGAILGFQQAQARDRGQRGQQLTGDILSQPPVDIRTPQFGGSLGRPSGPSTIGSLFTPRRERR